MVVDRRRLAAFGVTDTVYAFQVAQDTHVDDAGLDAGWMLAIGAFGLAASSRPRTGAARRLDGMSVLAVPGLCALAALGLLFEGFLATGNPLAGTGALGAVVTSGHDRGALNGEPRRLATVARSRPLTAPCHPSQPAGSVLLDTDDEKS